MVMGRTAKERRSHFGGKKKKKNAPPPPPPVADTLEEVSRVLKSLEFKNPGPMMRDDPKGLGRRLRRQRVLLGSRKTQAGASMYNSQGCLLYCNRDLCDCLKLNCPGCFYPCPRCKSPKCGLECRVLRKWTVKWIYCEDRPSVTTDNPFLLPILQQLKKDKQENKS